MVRGILHCLVILDKLKRHFINHTESLCFTFQTLGKVGRVQQIYHDNDLKVSYCVTSNLFKVNCSKVRSVMVNEWPWIWFHESGSQLGIESDPGLLWFPFTLLWDWPRKLTPPSQPIKKIKI